MTIYDSSEQRATIRSTIRDGWTYRGLLALVVRRNLTIRYKRSVLGIWWTALNPMLTVAVMYLVFARLFRFATPGQPYIVYLLSGVLLITFFSQCVTQTANSILGSAAILKKVYVPPIIFPGAAGLAAACSFSLSLIPLVLVQLATGVGIPWTIVFVPFPVLLMFVFATGVGLLVAAAAIYFYDILEITNVLLQLIGYLTPSFYPISIVPERFRIFVELNPLYSYLEVFRGFMYQHTLAPLPWIGYMVASAVFALALGSWVFGISWKRLVVLL